MHELSLNILDIAYNSIRAGAKKVLIKVDICTHQLSITITDDGCGMTEEQLMRVTDPFYTTRKTRKVGLGLSLFKMQAELAGGRFEIVSKLGQGTTVFASFLIGDVDRLPLGDLASSITTLIGAAPDTDFELQYTFHGQQYTFCTQEVKQLLEQTDLCDTTTLIYLTELIQQNIHTINGGEVI